MKICIVNLHMLEGWSGVERVGATFCEALIARGHDVTVAARKPKDDASEASKKLRTRMPEGAGVLTMDLWDKANHQSIREEIARQGFDVAVGMFGNRSWLAFPWLFAGSGVPLIGAEHQFPELHLNKYGRIWQAYEYYGTMAGMDSIAVLLKPFADLYPATIRERIAVIGNPIDVVGDVPSGGRERILLGVGRFEEEQKRFGLLIAAFAKLADEYPDWKLKLVGDGPAASLYKMTVASLGLAGRVIFTGAVPDPSPHYAGAEVFCMPSRYESFGLVLGEAAHYELPLSGFASCDAAKTLVPPDCGVLAGDDTADSLAAALRPLMDADSEKRREIGRNAKRFFTDNYAPERISEQWESLLTSTVQRVRNGGGETQLSRILREIRAKEVKIDPMDGEIFKLEARLSELRQQLVKINKARMDIVERLTAGGGKGEVK